MRDAEKKISEYLPDSVCFRVNNSWGNEHCLRECYADTGETGFEIHDRAHLLGCAYLNNKFQFNLNKITVIDHRAGYLDVQSCVFRPEGENVTFYKGNGEELYWGESNYLTFEREKDYYTLAKENIKKSGKENMIEIVFGDAYENVKKLNGKYDVIFMDANKSMYRYYFDTLFPLLNKGGVIICDNILYKGMISNDDLAPRKQNTIITNIREFLTFISNDPRLETSIIPIGDGVSVSVKLCD